MVREKSFKIITLVHFMKIRKFINFFGKKKALTGCFRVIVHFLKFVY